MTDRKIIGFRPLYAPTPGSIVTQAFICCSMCGKAIATTGGIVNDAFCFGCVQDEGLRYNWLEKNNNANSR